jgi:hypothetical protein
MHSSNTALTPSAAGVSGLISDSTLAAAPNAVGMGLSEATLSPIFTAGINAFNRKAGLHTQTIIE